MKPKVMPWSQANALAKRVVDKFNHGSIENVAAAIKSSLADPEVIENSNAIYLYSKDDHCGILCILSQDHQRLVVKQFMDNQGALFVRRIVMDRKEREAHQ